MTRNSNNAKKYLQIIPIPFRVSKQFSLYYLYTFCAHLLGDYFSTLKLMFYSFSFHYAYFIHYTDFSYEPRYFTVSSNRYLYFYVKTATLPEAPLSWNIGIIL